MTISKALLTGGITLGFLIAGCSKGVTQTPKANTLTERDSIAYAWGVLNGERFAQSLTSMPGDSLSRNHILEGFSKGFSQQGGIISSSKAQQIIRDYFKSIEEREVQTLKLANDSVLSVNATREGVTTTESGLQWRLLRAGKGKQPTELDSVVVHYIGRTADGKEFDNSYRRGRPATFVLGQLIAGWREGLLLMQEGSKYEFYIPYQLGYGERGQGSAIPPYSTLIFDVELLEVKPQQASQAPQGEEKQQKTARPARGRNKK